MKIITIIFLIVIYLIILAISLLTTISSWIIYKKAGRKGWESLIPFYNVWILITKISSLNSWWMLIYLSPIIILILQLIGGNISTGITLISYILCYICMFAAYYNLSKKFNHTTADAIAILLIPNIMYPIIAFSNNWIYNNEIEVSNNGPFRNSEPEKNDEEE